MTTRKKILNDLNPKQRQAVEHEGGPLFVVAGAGTGKTKTLVSRLAYLIEEGCKPERLLAITFTNKAAREMRERAGTLLYPKSSATTWIHTFHAFGLRVLNRDIEKLNLGITRGFAVIDDVDSVQIVREIIKDMNLDSKKYLAKATRNVISKIKNNQSSDQSESDETYMKITKTYNRYLIKNNLVDFDDLLIHVLALLKTSAVVRDKYQEMFDHILVDEFQDTNQIQYEIVKILADKHKNIFIVGDPDQSIYSFRGANYQNSQSFIDYFGGKMIVLETNYRSTNEILSVANKLIANNNSRPVTKDLVSYRENNGATVEIIDESSDLAETYFIANEIGKLVKSGKYGYGDVAVLYRANAISRIFEETFMRGQIPYVIYSGVSFFQRREIKDAIAYLRVVMNTNQDFYLKRIINVPRRKIGLTTLDKLEDFSTRNLVSIFDTIERVELPQGTKKSLNEFKALIRDLQEAVVTFDNPGQFLDFVLSETGYYEMLKQEGEDGFDRIDNLRELKSIFVRGGTYYEGGIIDQLQAVLDEISLISDVDIVVDEDNAVKLSTVHQVKGLEFKVVFVVALENGIFPNLNNLGSAFELEEERRVCYVAITRAKERLYLTYAGQRFRFGSLTYNPPSVFIKELLPQKSIQPEPQPQFYENTNISYQPPKRANLINTDDRVSHRIFGEGIVIKNEEGILTVAFKMPHGLKRILEDHPAIKKVNK